MIYFVLARGTGNVKIGYTDSEPKGRVSTLAIGCPSELRILHTEPGDRDREAHFHKQFAPLRTRGEWFHLGPPLLAYLADQIIAAIPRWWDPDNERPGWRPCDQLSILHWLNDELDAPSASTAGYLWSATGERRREGCMPYLSTLHGCADDAVSFAVAEADLRDAGFVRVTQLLFPWAFPAFLLDARRYAIVERLNQR